MPVNDGLVPYWDDYVDEDACLYCDPQYVKDITQKQVEVEDYLITPKVSGTVSIGAFVHKYSGYQTKLIVYEVDDFGENVEYGKKHLEIQ